MTEGPILKKMLVFAWPMLTGMMLQQFYNTVDAIVVGNFVGPEALAAVGNTSAVLVNIVIAFAFGLFAGANVLISQFFGAGDHINLQKMVHTEFLLSLVLGIFLAVVGIVFTPALLRLIDTPIEVLPGAIMYLRIYFIGLPVMFLYNAGATILTALGNSRSPLLYLLVATFINIVGDLAFVLIFDWGIAGVAISTVLAQVVTMILVLRNFRRAAGSHRLIVGKLRIHWDFVSKAAAIGIPGGIQGTIVSFSNFFVQSYINGLGSVVMAGYSASSRIDAFAGMPIQTMSLVLATFVGQNLGANQVKRARMGVKYGIMLTISLVVVMSGLIFAFSDPLLRLFSSDTDVLEYGRRFIVIFAAFYFLLSTVITLPGALRGAGDVRFATITCVVCFVGVRQIYLFIISRLHYTIETVAAAYPITWLLAGTAIIIYYLKSDWQKYEKMAESDEASE